MKSLIEDLDEMVDKNAELEENEDLLNLEGYKEKPTKIQNLN